jgi:CPA2 family monovalent cation:H+ antiporter-2
VNDARLVNVALTDPVAARRCVAMVRDLAPQTRIIARTHYVAEVDALSEAGADEVVVEEFEAGIELVRVALRAFQFPVESVERFTEQMRDEGYELMRAPPALALDPWLTEVLSEVGTDWLDVSADTVVVGRSIESLDVRRRTGASVLAVERQGQTTANPDPSLELAVGDRLLLFGSAEDLANVRKLLCGDDFRSRA